MRSLLRTLVFSIAALPLGWSGSAAQTPPGPPAGVDLDMVARIREEGLQRSQLANTFSYMTDVLGARLTNSRDMHRAQEWVLGEMRRIGLVNTVREPFMDYGVSWDNEYVSLHLMEPDYTPMVGYPIAHTPGMREAGIDLGCMFLDRQEPLVRRERVASRLPGTAAGSRSTGSSMRAFRHPSPSFCTPT